MYTIVASPLFKLSQQRLKAFLTAKYGATLAIEALNSIKNQIRQQLPANPELAPISERLQALGIKDYRQWQVDKHNMVFYRVDHQQQQIALLAMMDSRQNIRKLLFELMLLME